MNTGLPRISVAQTLADKIVALKVGALPAITRRKCEDLLIDVVGLCVTARNEDYVASSVQGCDDDGSCTAIGHKRTLTAAGAAFVNGTAAHGHGGVGLGAFCDRAIRDERVLALAAKVKFAIDPDNPYPNNYTGHIRASMKDGGVFEERQPYLRGGAQEPLTRQDVTDKFILNAEHGGWSKAQSDAALNLMAGLYNGRIDLSSLRG